MRGLLDLGMSVAIFVVAVTGFLIIRSRHDLSAADYYSLGFGLLAFVVAIAALKRSIFDAYDRRVHEEKIEASLERIEAILGRIADTLAESRAVDAEAAPAARRKARWLERFRWW